MAAGQRYRHADFTVPADFSSAAFIVAAVGSGRWQGGARGPGPGAATGRLGHPRNRDLDGREGDQGARSVTVESDGERLKGGTFNLGDTPDLLPVVAALALRSDTPVEVVGTAHARFKETDRIAILAERALEAGRQDRGEAGRPEAISRRASSARTPRRARRPPDVHGLLAGLDARPGRDVPVMGAESLDVSYPNFLEDIKKLGAGCRTLDRQHRRREVRPRELRGEPWKGGRRRHRRLSRRAEALGGGHPAGPRPEEAGAVHSHDPEEGRGRRRDNERDVQGKHDGRARS